MRPVFAGASAASGAPEQSGEENGRVGGLELGTMEATSGILPSPCESPGVYKAQCVDGFCLVRDAGVQMYRRVVKNTLFFCYLSHRDESSKYSIETEMAASKGFSRKKEKTFSLLQDASL